MTVMSSWRGRVLGDDRRFGLWLLPLFLISGLLGASLAGALAVLYYAQEVTQLREQTAGSRAQLDEAVADAEEAVEEGVGTIDERVAIARDLTDVDLPLDSVTDTGIYAVAVRHADGSIAVGSGFPVLSTDEETAVLTAFELVVDSTGRSADTAEVFISDETVTGRIHDVDEARSVAVIALAGGTLPVPEWRPSDESLELGDPVWLAGVAGPDTGSLVEGRVSGVSGEALVTTVPVNRFLAGGPLLDRDGRVVGVAATDYQPFGPSEGAVTYSLPIRQVCESVVQCTATDLGSGVPEPALPAPGARSREPDPPPEPTPTPPADDDDADADEGDGEQSDDDDGG